MSQVFEHLEINAKASFHNVKNKGPIKVFSSGGVHNQGFHCISNSVLVKGSLRK